MAVIASVGPAAREVFSRLDGRTFGTPAEFGRAFEEALSQMGPMPRFFSSEEAIDWGTQSGSVIVDPDGAVHVRLHRAVA